MKHIKLFEQFVNERNAFLAARAKAIEEGLDEFEFNGKIYPIKSKASKQQVVSEAEIKSDAEFKEYAETVLKKAFGEDYDEAKGQKIIDGILGKVDGDYGAAVGMLTSSLG